MSEDGNRRDQVGVRERQRKSVLEETRGIGGT